MSDPTVNSQIVVERLPSVQGFPNQRLNIVIDPGVSFSLYLEDRANSDFNSNAAQITATGLPLIATPPSGTVTGSGTTNQVPKWTNGPGSVLGDSSISDTGAVVTITIPSLALVGTTITFPDDIRQTFNPGANNAGLNVGSLAGDPATPSNGDVWYDSGGNRLRARINGASVSLGSNTITVNSTAIAGGVAGRLLYETSGNLFGEISGATSDGTNLTAGSGNLRATSPRITTGINDANGNASLLLTPTADAVNQFTLINAAAGNSPAFSATGSDTDISVIFTPKGAGNLTLTTGHFRGPDGTGALPAYSFTSNTDTGFSNSGGSLIFSTGGTVVEVFGGSGAIFLSTRVIGFSTDPLNVAPDVALSRISAGLMGLGTGAAASFAGSLKLTDLFTNNAAALIKTNTTLTDNAGAGVGTLTNAPTAGNPTKWVAFNDNGTTRYIPTWT